MTKVSGDSQWVQHGEIALNRKHQIVNGSELCDMHVNAFQNLIRVWFPNVGGLQNTLLQTKYAIDNSGTPILQTGQHSM